MNYYTKIDKIESLNYSINKYLKIILSLSIFKVLFLIISIITFAQWTSTNNSEQQKLYVFIAFISLFTVFFICTSLLSLFCYLKFFYKNKDIFPTHFYNLSIAMIVFPSICSIVLFPLLKKHLKELKEAKI